MLQRKTEMKVNERYMAAFKGQSADRAPLIENSIWWDATVNRWISEGLPRMGYTYSWRDQTELMEYFGLDIVGQWALDIYTPATPFGHGKGMARTEGEYERILPTLYPKPEIDAGFIGAMKKLQNEGKAVLEFMFHGPFWEPREIMGIEKHLFSFYDDPGFYKRIVEDLKNWQKKALDYLSDTIKFDFITVAEDMSYNNGPMIGKDVFDEFIAPYYREMVPLFKQAGYFVTVDSDGDINLPIEWYNEVGVEGYHPLEKQAGMDINALQKKFPSTAFMGNFDKMVMSKGEAAIRAEFERIAPAMKRGRYIVSVDHQTPPEVSLENYKIYNRLLKEYAKPA